MTCPDAFRPAPSCFIPEETPRALGVEYALVLTKDRFRADWLKTTCARAFPRADVRVARTACAALELLVVEPADLILTGLDFPDTDGVAVLPRLRRQCRCLVVVSTRTDDWTIMNLRDASFDGFFDPDEDDPAVLAWVLPRLVAGAAYYSLSVKERLLAARLQSPLTEKLTTTELNVLRRIADGSTDAEAARDLGMSERTAADHGQNIRNKLGVRTRARLVIEALRLGLAPRGLWKRD